MQCSLTESGGVHAKLAAEEHGMVLQVRWFLEQWDVEEDWITSAIARANLRRYGKPRVLDGKFNLIVNVGKDVVLKLVTGASATALNNANANIGVGDSSTAAAVGQTGLQAATNKKFKGMNTGYPTAVASQKTSFQADFTSTEALFAWNEWCLASGNDPPTTGVMLSRKSESFGTKGAALWTFNADLTA